MEKQKESCMTEEHLEKSNLIGTILIMTIMMIFIGLIATVMNSCTYSITMVHTEGVASDVVDETATNTPSTSVVIPSPAI